MDETLAMARMVHLIASVSVCGVVWFRHLVAEPAFFTLATNGRTGVVSVVRKMLSAQLAMMFWASLALFAISGVVWFLDIVANLSERPTSELFSDPTAWILLTRTQFGFIWTARLAVALGLALADRIPTWSASADKAPLKWLSVSLAAVLLATLAAVGHSGAMPGLEGGYLMTADGIHLIAVGAWLGGLVPLTLLLRLVERHSDPSSLALAATATRRFSIVGLVAVSALLVTGIVNTSHLVGSPVAMIESGYGRLLLVKIALFGAMVCIAAVNYRRLTPQLGTAGTLRRLRRNTLVEVALGLAIIGIVSFLGISPPAAHSGHIH